MGYRKHIYVVILIGLLSAPLFYIFPSASKVSLYLRALAGTAETAIVGNSVIRAVSKCDNDKRSLAGLLRSGNSSILDMSFGGQSIEYTANMAALAAKNSNVKNIIVGLSMASFRSFDNMPLRDLIFFGLSNPSLLNSTIRKRIDENTSIFTGRVALGQKSFKYKGTRYPSYEGLKYRYFIKEKEAMSCPENDGYDMDFVEAYYHRVYSYDVTKRAIAENVALLASLNSSIDSHSKRLTFVFMPVNHQLIEKISPATVESIKHNSKAVAALLEGQEIKPLDLSYMLPNEDFCDRWCACGHLCYTGRQKVASRIYEYISENNDIGN